MPLSPQLRPHDAALLRRSFAIAARSREAGDHPFGCLLADAEGKVLMEQGNGYTSEGGDRTAHAEKLLAARAAKAYETEFLQTCTLYSSAEPCAMCAGALYWAGIDTSHLAFDTAVSTANGMGRAAVVNLATIDVGGIVRHDIRAYITAGGALDTSLLGMTFLETLNRYAVTRDSLQLTN